jgi:hypothetical protein
MGLYCTARFWTAPAEQSDDDAFGRVDDGVQVTHRSPRPFRPASGLGRCLILAARGSLPLEILSDVGFRASAFILRPLPPVGCSMLDVGCWMLVVGCSHLKSLQKRQFNHGCTRMHTDLTGSWFHPPGDKAPNGSNSTPDYSLRGVTFSTPAQSWCPLAA